MPIKLPVSRPTAVPTGPESTACLISIFPLLPLAITADD